MIFYYYAPVDPEGTILPTEGAILDHEDDDENEKFWIFTRPGPALSYVQNLAFRRHGEYYPFMLRVELHSMLRPGERNLSHPPIEPEQHLTELDEVLVSLQERPPDKMNTPGVRTALALALDWLREASELEKGEYLRQ